MSDYTDEALWFGYAKAAMLIPSNCGDRMNRGLASASLVPAHAASDATAMLAEHRKRWPQVTTQEADAKATRHSPECLSSMSRSCTCRKSCETCRHSQIVMLCGDDTPRYSCRTFGTLLPMRFPGCHAHEPKE
jgi:hypothetical protein